MVGKTGPIVLLPAWERSHDLRIAIVQAKVDLGIAAARGWRLGRDRRRLRRACEGPSPTQGDSRIAPTVAPVLVGTPDREG